MAGARSADDAEDLARTHVEIEPVVDHRVAELVLKAADTDGAFELFRPHGVGGGEFLEDFGFGLFGHQFHPSVEKKTANLSSTTMPRKIAESTADVDRRPTSSAVWRTGIHP